MCTLTNAAPVRVFTRPLRLLFSNLVRNACRYNAREPVKIEIQAERRNGALNVRVADNGIGIPAAERENVFKEFYRLKDSTGRGKGGSGLGLAICRKIMDVHQGRIRVEASSPEGTTFALEFPA